MGYNKMMVFFGQAGSFGVIVHSLMWKTPIVSLSEMIRSQDFGGQWWTMVGNRHQAPKKPNGIARPEEPRCCKGIHGWH